VTRNRKIAEVARQYDDTTQVLITCETVEHAMALKKELPEFTVVHAENAITDYDRSYYARQGIWPPAHPTMTADRRWELTRAFENGSLKKVIVTTVWNVGVSFDALEVLIRAEAGGSAIMDTQIPGRASRLFDDKSCGTIHDFVDNWDGGFKNRSGARRNNYAKHGWTQTYADDKQKTPPAQAPLFSQEDA
jgi:superfamily II DNA or RNA helicase